MGEVISYTEKQLVFFQNELWRTFLESDQIHLTWMTELIPPKLLLCAADVIIAQLQRDPTYHEINKVVGVPTKGLHLQTAIAIKLDLLLTGAHKGGSSPKQWLHPLVLTDGMKQFRNGDTISHVLGGIEQGDHILLVDDVLAKGGVMLPVVDNFLRFGIKPVVATYGAMLFEAGYKGLLDRGIKPAYAVGFKNIQPDGRLILER